MNAIFAILMTIAVLFLAPIIDYDPLIVFVIMIHFYVLMNYLKGGEKKHGKRPTHDALRKSKR